MTKETEVIPAPTPAMASRDREEDPPKVEAKPGVETEITEEFEVDPLKKVEKDYEDVLIDSEDPRAHIYKRHNEKRDQELADQGEIDPENTEIDDENTDLGVENNESGAIIDAQDDNRRPAKGEEMVEVLVYGDMHRVPKSRVDKAGGLQAYQKHLAVEKGLEINAHREKSLDEREKDIDDRESRVSTKAAVPAQDPHKANPTDLPSDDQNLVEMARQYQEAVYDGGDSAPSILAGMVAHASQSGEKFDKDAFRVQVKDEVLADQRYSKIVKARTKLFADTPELNKKDVKFDPRLFTAIDDETPKVERDHPELEPEQVIQEAYSRISKWKGGQKPIETMKDKHDAKREMNRPKASNQRFKPSPPAPRPTNSDYVAEQRRLRGQEA